MTKPIPFRFLLPFATLFVGISLTAQIPAQVVGFKKANGKAW